LSDHITSGSKFDQIIFRPQFVVDSRSIF